MLLMYRDRLSGHLVDLRKGRVTESEDEIQLMRDLVEQNSNFSGPFMSPQEANTALNEPITTNHDAQSSEHEGENIVSCSHPSTQPASQ